MSKSIIRAYTAWWPEEGVTTRQEAKEQSVTEQWTAEYMKSEGFSEEDINIVEYLQSGESHTFDCGDFDVVICYDGETYEDTSYQFQTERECHHLDWYEVSGRGDRYDDRY